MNFVQTFLLTAALVAAGIFTYDALKEPTAGAPTEIDADRLERLENELRALQTLQSSRLEGEQSPKHFGRKLAQLEMQMAQLMDKAHKALQAKGGSDASVKRPKGLPSPRELEITRLITKESTDPEAVKVIKRLIAEVRREEAVAEELRRYDAIIKQSGIKISEEDKPRLVRRGQELRGKLNALRRRGAEEQLPIEAIREEKIKLANEYRRVFNRHLTVADAESFLRRFIPPQAQAMPTEEPPANEPTPLPTEDD